MVGQYRHTGTGFYSLEYNFLKLNTNNGAHEESSELNSVVDPDPYLICGSGSIHINI